MPHVGGIPCQVKSNNPSIAERDKNLRHEKECYEEDGACSRAKRTRSSSPQACQTCKRSLRTPGVRNRRNPRRKKGTQYAGTLAPLKDPMVFSEDHLFIVHQGNPGALRCTISAELLVAEYSRKRLCGRVLPRRVCEVRDSIKPGGLVPGGFVGNRTSSFTTKH